MAHNIHLTIRACHLAGKQTKTIMSTSTKRVVYLILSMVFSFLTIVVGYFGLILYAGTDTDVANPDAAGTKQGLNDLFNIFSGFIVFVAIVLGILSTVFITKFFKAARASVNK